MRIVVGVDGEGGFEHTLRLLQSLDFDDVHIHLVHVIEPVAPGLESMYPADASHGYAQLLRALEERGKSILEEAKANCDAAGMSCECSSAFGNSASQLGRVADECNADLLAVASGGKGKFARVFIGSVSQALTNTSKHSLLVVKGEPVRSEGLKAVFATDHSKYARECEDLLFQMAPKGLAHLSIVTADDIDEQALLEAFGEDENRASSMREELQMDLCERTQEVADRFKGLDIHTDAKFVAGKAVDAIDRAADAIGADVVIVGAKGHGFMERLTLGSVSLHEVLHGKRTVLVLRP